MSPLQINILLHYWTRCEDWNKGDFTAPVVKETIDHFAAIGLLLTGSISSQYHPTKYHGNREALEPYVNALCAVPLPVQRWVIPEVA